MMLKRLSKVGYLTMIFARDCLIGWTHAEQSLTHYTVLVCMQVPRLQLVLVACAFKCTDDGR